MDNEILDVAIKIISEQAVIPKRATEHSSGYDLYSADDVIIQPGKTKLIKTGIKIKVPNGYEMQIRTRSGIAIQYGVMVLNSPGTIDADYTGEIGIILANFGESPFIVNIGDRIAQGVVSKVEKINFILVDELPISDRGSGGFGSTGIK